MALPHPCHTQSRASIPQVKVTKKEAPPLGCRCMWFSLSNQCLWARWGTLKSCLSWEERPLTRSWKERNVLFLSYSNLEWSLIIAELGEKRGNDLGSNITDFHLFYWMNKDLGKLQELVRDSKAWHAEVHGLLKRWTWLGDWKTKKPWIFIYFPE